MFSGTAYNGAYQSKDNVPTATGTRYCSGACQKRVSRYAPASSCLWSGCIPARAAALRVHERGPWSASNACRCRWPLQPAGLCEIPPRLSMWTFRDWFPFQGGFQQQFPNNYVAAWSPSATGFFDISSVFQVNGLAPQQFKHQNYRGSQSRPRNKQRPAIQSQQQSNNEQVRG